MTIYGTPGGTPANMNPFQGTQPGGPVGPTLQPINPGVGFFPPNSNNNSGDTVMAAISGGAVPANAQPTNGAINRQPRALLDALGAAGGAGTNNGSVTGGVSIMNQSTNGAVGNNFDAGPTAGSSSIVAGSAP